MNLEQLNTLVHFAYITQSGAAAPEHEDRVFEELARLGLTDGAAVTPRGMAFIRHLCALPLPERVTAWQVPRITHSPGAFLDDVAAFGVGALRISGIEEGEGEPPKGPMPKPFATRIEIPSDPEALNMEANRLLDSGMGQMEVAHALDMTEEQVARIFRGA